MATVSDHPVSIHFRHDPYHYYQPTKQQCQHCTCQTVFIGGQAHAMCCMCGYRYVLHNPMVGTPAGQAPHYVPMAEPEWATRTNNVTTDSREVYQIIS